jgi:dual specificity tyrosine-phosphorylation-regulated kinase 2/3/4
MTRKFTQ